MATVTPVRSGVRVSDNGETWTNWWLFPRLSETEERDFIESEDLCAHYGGPGCAFVRHPWARHSHGHTLITQSGGYDI